MKRSAEQAKTGDTVLPLPSNCTLQRCSFNLASLSDVEYEDVDLITNVITRCALEIAQKHHRVGVYIASFKETFQGYKLFKYTVQMEMPEGVPLPTSHQTNAIHCLSTTLIVDPIELTFNAAKGGYVMEVPIYSHKNPFTIAYKSITHVMIKELVLVSHQQPVESGPTKRARNESRKSA